MMWRCSVVLALIIAVLIAATTAVPNQYQDIDTDDNEFAEFEEFDDEDKDDDVDNVNDDSPTRDPDDDDDTADDNDDDNDDDDDDATVEDDDDEEFEHFSDEEEFVGFEKDKPTKGTTRDKPMDLKITNIPLHLRTNWDSFVLEMLMLAGLMVYFLNFLAGKNKNNKLAQAWFNAHRELLESNFAIVGDDGQTKEAQSGELIKESENIYALWCTGRHLVEGMLVELKLLKRQDLVNTISRILKPNSDQIVVTVNMEVNMMEKFVFAIGQKKTIARLQKDYTDLNQFCLEKKSTDKYKLPSSYQVLSEIGDATASLLDNKVCQILEKYDGVVEYLHFSDQYSGPKPQDSDNQTTKMPEGKPVLIFCFNVPGKGKSSPADMETMLPLFKLIFYCVEKVNKMFLSKEAKAKAEKNRQKAEETFLKTQHTQFQEAAQLRREEKRRAEKEKLLNEEDPDKARKLEDRENRRQMKKKTPKMKSMKVKAN